MEDDNNGEEREVATGWKGELKRGAVKINNEGV